MSKSHSQGKNFYSIILISTFALFAVFYSSWAAALTIRVGYPQLNGGQTPLWNIPEGKIDRQYSIDVSPVYIPGGVRLTQTIVSGNVDVALTGGAAVNAMLQRRRSHLRRHAGSYLCIFSLCPAGN
jgi:ABC-type nitrate/sulfonate/bicarbonate transport system substrate-binding protein